MRTGLLIAGALALGATALGQTTYTWNVASGAFTDSASWTPARTAPAANDVLAFNSTATVTGLATQGVGKILLSGGAQVTFSGTGGSEATVSVSGGTDALLVPAGCSLTLTGGGGATGVIIVDVAAGSTATIGGDIVFAATAGATPHRLNANAASAITFTSGATVAMAPTTTGAAGGFGSSAQGFADGVVFQAGSTYYQGGFKDGVRPGGTGSNPFARTAPASNVVFQAGSSYVNLGAIPATSGRTYGSLIWRDGYGADRAVGGGSAMVIANDLVIDLPGGSRADAQPVAAGAISFNQTGAATINGNFTMNTGCALFKDTAAPGALTAITFAGNVTIQDPGRFQRSTNANREYVFGGTANQAVDVNAACFSAVRVNNAAGITLTSPLAVLTSLTVTTGAIAVSGDGALLLGSSVTAPGGYSGPVGGVVAYDATQLTPVTTQSVTFTPTVAGTGTVASFSVLPRTGAATGLPSGGTGAARTWEIQAPGAAGFTGDLAITYLDSDITGLTEADLKLARFDGANWVDVPATVNTGTNTITATGVTAFSPWTIYALPAASVSDWRQVD